MASYSVKGRRIGRPPRLICACGRELTEDTLARRGHNSKSQGKCWDCDRAARTAQQRRRRTHCPCGVLLTAENRALDYRGFSRGLCVTCRRSYNAQKRYESNVRRKTHSGTPRRPLRSWAAVCLRCDRCDTFRGFDGEKCRCRHEETWHVRVEPLPPLTTKP